jgi:hypothetical protein
VTTSPEAPLSISLPDTIPSISPMCLNEATYREFVSFKRHYSRFLRLVSGLDGFLIGTSPETHERFLLPTRQIPRGKDESAPQLLRLPGVHEYASEDRLHGVWR